jgi:hypothetical protein
MVGVMARYVGDDDPRVAWEQIRAKQRALDEAVQRTVQRTEEEAARRSARYEAASLAQAYMRMDPKRYDDAETERQLAEQIYQQRMSPEESLRLLASMEAKGPHTRSALKVEGVKVSTVDAQLKQKLQERRDEREVAARLALVDAYGEDVYPVGTVITFDKAHGSKSYPYAALKAEVATNEQWYTTGAANSAAIHTWDTLVEFLVSGPKPVKSFILKAEGGTTVPGMGVK